MGPAVDVRPVRAGQRTDDPTGPLTARAGGRLPGQVRHQGRRAPHRPADNAHCSSSQRVCRDLAERAFEADGTLHRMRCWASGCTCWASAATSHEVAPLLGHSRRAAAGPGPLASPGREVPESAEPIDLADIEARLLADEDEDNDPCRRPMELPGSGWRTAGDEALALAAAARARDTPSTARSRNALHSSSD